MIDQAIEKLLSGGDVADAVQQIAEGGYRRRKPTRRRRSRGGIKQDVAYRSLRSKLRPGDVMVVGTKRKANTRVTGAYYKASKKLFKNDKNIHVSMYAGDDTMYDAYAGKGALKTPLRDQVANRRHITVLRPKATKKERDAALRFARKQMGKKFAYRSMAGAALKELHPKIPTPGLRSKDAFTCAGLVACSYPTLNVKGRKRHAGHASPKDFRRSRDFREVMRMDRNKSGKFRVKVARRHRQRRRR